MTTKTDAVREALDSLVLTISRLRPKMKLPTQAEWDDLEEAHNRAARALSPAAPTDAPPAGRVEWECSLCPALFDSAAMHDLHVANAHGNATPAAKPDAPGGEYCDVVAGCVWPKGHGGIGHCLTVGGTPPPTKRKNGRKA